MTGQTVLLSVLPTDRVEDLMSKITEREGLPAGEQRLLFQGLQLESGRTLASYGLQHMSCLHLVLRMIGGY